MDWLQQVDGYCERLGPDYWAEPVNAVTNAAFLIAALLMAWRLRALPPGLGHALVAVLAAIGIGSYLFHTHANRLTGLMDVLPILIFILLYVFAASRDYLGWKGWQAGLAVLAFFPYAAVMLVFFQMVAPWLGSSAGYAPVPVLILLYAYLLWAKAPATAQGLAIGAGILTLSLTFRTLDGPLCTTLPVGTHFLWHIFNGVMLGWMIEVWRRHRLAAMGPRG